MLLTPSATFDERLIQRCGSGETENSSSRSGLATPQDEDVQPLGPGLDLKHAANMIENEVSQQPLLQERRERQLSKATTQKEYPRTTVKSIRSLMRLAADQSLM